MSTTTHVMYSNPSPPRPPELGKRIVKVGGDSLMYGNVYKYEHSRPLLGRESLTIYLKSGEILRYDGTGIDDFLSVFRGKR